MKKGKLLALTLTATLSLSAVLAGTYAWQSVNQKQRNEYRGTVSSGGRLHDDFNGLNAYSAGRNVGNKKVKKVYAENFTDEANGGQKIYARIRLSEYLELGVGAGKAGAANRVPENLTIVGADESHTPELENKSSWIPYLWEQEGLEGSDASNAFRNYIEIANGTKTVYLPTYNMDQDSAAAEINGTLEGNDGKVETTTDAYGDYVAYTDGQNVWGVEVTALNEKGEDEMNAAGITVEQLRDAVMEIDPENGTMTLKLAKDDAQIDILGNGTTYDIQKNRENETHIENFDIDFNADGIWDIEVNVPDTPHTAKETAETEAIISMETWMKTGAEGGKDKQPGNYWVYDTDGWVYWANPIKPGETTGCLIDGISMASATKPTGEYYYGLDVQAQFATAGDWGKKGSTTSESFKEGDITANAIVLLNTIANQPAATYTVELTPQEGVTTLSQGSKMEFQVKVTSDETGEDLSSQLTEDNLTWTVEGSSTGGRSADTSRTTITKKDDSIVTAVLQIGENETSDDLTVKATYEDESGGTWVQSWNVKTDGNIERITKTSYTLTISAEETEANPDDSLSFTAVLTKTNGLYPEGTTVENPTLEWKVTGQSGATTISDGTLSIGSDETDGTQLTISAVYKDIVNANIPYPSNEISVTVKNVPEWKTQLKTITAGSTETVKIDNIDFYVAAKTSTQALLWSKDPVEARAFDVSSPSWKSSALRTYLNQTTSGGFLNSHPEIAKAAKQTTIWTRKNYNQNSGYESTDDKVFLLSEEDVLGTANNSTLPSDVKYTVDANLRTTIANQKVFSTTATGSQVNYCWLRSPCGNASQVAGINYIGLLYFNNLGNKFGIRPVFWVNL